MRATKTSRRSFIKSCVFGTAGLVCTPKSAKIRGEKPNFIFFLMDDLGWRDVGFMGSTYYETPNIDKIADQGIVFTSAYANAPNCAPTRACLLSGQYSPRHGVYTVGSPERGQPQFRKLIPVKNSTTLSPDNLTFVELLKEAGYISASIGKWHLGRDPESGPVSQGFDINIAGNRAGHPSSYFSPYENDDLSDGPAGEYLTDRLTREALEFIDNHKDRPFFLYLPHFAVHTPIQAKKELEARYRSKPVTDDQNNPAYAAMIESADAGIGRILDRLETLKLANRTVVVFFSDNGGHANSTSMKPLRGSKGQLYEGGIRVPLAVRWPAMINPGSRCDVPVIGLDFYPTILELAGVSIPADKIVDGVSLVPILAGEQRSINRALFWHFPAYLEPYNESQLPWRITPSGAIRLDEWKLVEFFEDNRLELYNLEQDIGETDNLVNQNPERVSELLHLLKEWQRAVVAPIPQEPNPLYDPAAVATMQNNR